MRWPLLLAGTISCGALLGTSPGPALPAAECACPECPREAIVLEVQQERDACEERVRELQVERVEVRERVRTVRVQGPARTCGPPPVLESITWAKTGDDEHCISGRDLARLSIREARVANYIAACAKGE